MLYRAPEAPVQVADVKGLTRFVIEELRQVEAAMASLGSFGTLTLDPGVPVPWTLTTTWTKLQIFPRVGAAGRFQGIVPVINPDARLVGRDAGIYFWGFDIEAQIPQGQEIQFEIYFNGQPSGIVAVVDASNQTQRMTYSAFGLIRAAGVGGYAEVFGRVPAGTANITVERTQFLGFRVGE